MSKNLEGLNSKVEKLKAKLAEAQAEYTAKLNEVKIETADKLNELCDKGGFDVEDALSLLKNIAENNIDISAVINALPDLYNSKNKSKSKTADNSDDADSAAEEE